MDTPITLTEVKTFINEWFETVASGANGNEQAQFYLHRDARIFTGSGDTFTLDQHHQLHQQWKNEKHILGPLELTAINDKPQRVRVTGTVYWQAQPVQASDDDPIIKAVVGEHWIIEKTPQGLRFVLYISTTFQLLPDSAPLSLEMPVNQ